MEEQEKPSLIFGSFVGTGCENGCTEQGLCADKGTEDGGGTGKTCSAGGHTGGGTGKVGSGTGRVGGGTGKIAFEGVIVGCTAYNDGCTGNGC